MASSSRSTRPVPFIASFLFLLLSIPTSEVAGLLSSLRTSSPPRPSFLRSETSPSNDNNDPSPNEFRPSYTGHTKELNWELANPPIPIRSEVELLKSGVLWRRGEFNRIEGKRVEQVERKCHQLGMTVDQGFFIRKQLAVTKVMRNTWKLTKKFDYVERIFVTQRRTLLQLSKELDLPPVSIVRAILKKRVDDAYPDMLDRDRKQIVKSIISEDNYDLVRSFLSEWEMKQLQIAKRSDVVGYSKEASEIESTKWEQAIYSFLDESQINFLTEDDMRLQGARLTPDCLILDECAINGRKLRWIDAKNYYGSGLRESSGLMKKMEKQIANYEVEFGGHGAIVFKHGFSQKFIQSFPSTLFLDAGPLHLGDVI